MQFNSAAPANLLDAMAGELMAQSTTFRKMVCQALNCTQATFYRKMKSKTTLSPEEKAIVIGVYLKILKAMVYNLEKYAASQG